MNSPTTQPADPSAVPNTTEFRREIPNVPWRGVFAAAAVFTTTLTAAWEACVRLEGYRPTLNDTPDLWAEQRRSVKPDSIVLLGTSRMLFDADLDVLEKGLGRRPVQLAIVGSSPFPILDDLANDDSFHGTVILDVVPAMYLAPAGPPVEASERALRRARGWTPAQRWSHRVGVFLEEHVAFIEQEDLTLGKMLGKLPIPDRANARIAPPLPPYFYTLDGDRRARMTDAAATEGSEVQHRVATGWIPLFTMPPPPSYVHVEEFRKMMGQAVERRFRDTAADVARIRARGGKVVFVRFPVGQPLIEREERLAPLAPSWERLVRDSGVPAINFSDFESLKAFTCPEWSHLSAPDSVEFTRRLVPHLQTALADGAAYPSRVAALAPE